VYSPNLDRSYSSKELRELDFKIRIESGFTHIWLDNELSYVQISDKSNLKNLANLLEISDDSIKRSVVDITEDSWNSLIPRLVYLSIREAADRKSPGEVWIRGENNQIFISGLGLRDFPEGLMHGLQFHVYRIDKSGLSIAVDYISHQPDGDSEQRSELLSPAERSTMISKLMDQVVPANGLPFCFGGIDFLFPYEQVVLDLVGDDL